MSRFKIAVQLDLGGGLVAAILPPSVGQIPLYFFGKFWLLVVLISAWISMVFFFWRANERREKKLPEGLLSNVKIPILIIDDDQNHLYLMKGVFEGLGYDLAVSRNLDDIRLVESFAIIVSDIMNVSLSSSPINNHSEELLAEIERKFPYKRIIRVSTKPGSGIILKDSGYEKKVKQEVDNFVKEMMAPRKYWDAISSGLRSRGIEEKAIDEAKKGFVSFLKTKLEQ